MIIQALLDLYKSCTLCPRACRVDRTKSELGYCRLPADIVMNCALAHHGEEPPLSGKNGAGTIFLSSCNLGCIYCQNYQISHSAQGRNLTVLQLAKVMLDLQKDGCHNVEPVTPTPQAPLMMEALCMARMQGLTVPFVYNCGGYENPEVITLLDGMVDIYLPDFKYEMVNQVGDGLELKNGVAQRGIIIRHLVLPGRIENSKEVLTLIKKKISTSVFISLMSQYTPIAKVRHHPILGRRITKIEYEQVTDYALKLGFDNIFVQEVNDYELTPDFDRDNPIRTHSSTFVGFVIGSSTYYTIRLRRLFLAASVYF